MHCTSNYIACTTHLESGSPCLSIVKSIGILANKHITHTETQCWLKSEGVPLMSWIFPSPPFTSSRPSVSAGVSLCPPHAVRCRRSPLVSWSVASQGMIPKQSKRIGKRRGWILGWDRMGSLIPLTNQWDGSLIILSESMGMLKRNLQRLDPTDKLDTNSLHLRAQTCWPLP